MYVALSAFTLLSLRTSLNALPLMTAFAADCWDVAEVSSANTALENPPQGKQCWI